MGKTDSMNPTSWQIKKPMKGRWPGMLIIYYRREFYKMNALNCFFAILTLFISSLAQASEPLPAVNDISVNVQNFDSQVIDIFKTVIEHPKHLPFSSDTGNSAQNMVLKTILAKFADHEMFLKNVVYRTDIDV